MYSWLLQTSTSVHSHLIYKASLPWRRVWGQRISKDLFYMYCKIPKIFWCICHKSFPPVVFWSKLMKNSIRIPQSTRILIDILEQFPNHLNSKFCKYRIMKEGRFYYNLTSACRLKIFRLVFLLLLLLLLLRQLIWTCYSWERRIYYANFSAYDLLLFRFLWPYSGKPCKRSFRNRTSRTKTILVA